MIKTGVTFFRNHEFFRHDNTDALALRIAVADTALNDTLKFLREDGDVGIFDATNTTRERRQKISDMVKENGFKCLFLESVCDNPKLIEVWMKSSHSHDFTYLIQSNILDVKIHGPDYENMDREEALDDFLRRIDHYKNIYQTMEEEYESHLSFMKIVNAGEKLIVNRHEGNLQSRIVYW